jgi:predicted 3-demethylubiquinone-9 3-methyltransferase (glyoxalase superfamily)
MNYYVSIFPDSKILEVDRYGAVGPAGDVITGSFELAGQRFMALNGGPEFRFNEAVSFFVDCESQDEIDELWQKLSADGGEPSQCGWLKDRFGLSWQIVPAVLGEMLSDQDAEKAQRVMQAMLQMSKLDIQVLQEAYAGA